MNESVKNALQYIENTGGGATRAIFIDDHEPIGEMLWAEIEQYVRVEDGKLYLNESGKLRLN